MYTTTNETSLETRVGLMLKQKGLKLAAAESCTGGLIGHLLTNIPGSSDYYLGSVTAYANEAKQRLLGVKPATLKQFGAVSRETVLEMASGIRKTMAADFSIKKIIGVSVSGIAGPEGGTPEKPVGLVWMGLSAPGLDLARPHQFSGSRLEVKEQAAESALQMVLEYLEGNLTHGKK